MPRKSFRQIALDELLGRYHGLYSNILIKYALESDSNIDSDRNSDSDRDSDIDDNELRTDAESSNDNDEPPKLVKYMIESDGESEDKSDSDDENEEPDEQIIAGFNSCIGAENYDDEDPPELEPRFLYEQNVDGGYDGNGDSGSVGSNSDSSNSGVGLDELLFLKVKDDLDAALDSRYLQRTKYRKTDDTVFRKHIDRSEGCFLNEEEFKIHYRCSRDAFDWIVSEIEDHSIFNNERGRKQAPVNHQLMLLMHFLGEESVSNRSQRGVYWKSRGNCEKSRERCVEAIRSLRDKYLYWPDEDERKDIAKRILNKYQIPNVVGIIDGTLLELAFMLESDDNAGYSGRKFQWSLSVMISNDDKGRIRYFLGGFPGTAHDNRIWKRTKIFKNKEDFFSAIEFLIGDTAFEPSDIMVSAYKNVPGVPMPRDSCTLNSAVSSPRVRSEHTIGILKGRFPWLRKIRKTITNDKQSIVEILKYIECCVILHNMLLEFGDDSPEIWREEYPSDFDDPNRAPEEDAMYQPLPEGAPKDARRTRLREYLRENYIVRAPHHIDSDDGFSSEDMDLQS